MPGAPVTEFEEMWRDLEPLAGPETLTSSKPQSWILESLNDEDYDSEQITVQKTWLGRIQGTFLALGQEQITKRITIEEGEKGSDGAAMRIVKTGGEVSARREEWVNEGQGWKAKYVLGSKAQNLPTPSTQKGGVFPGEGEGLWRRVGSVVKIGGQKYIVRAFEEA